MVMVTILYRCGFFKFQNIKATFWSLLNVNQTQLQSHLGSMNMYVSEVLKSKINYANSVAEQEEGEVLSL